MKKLKINSILFRLFLSFLLVMAPIMIAGIAMFSWEKQIIKNELVNSASANVSFLKNNLENEVQNIKLLEYNLTNDASVKKLIAQYDVLANYDYYILVTEVQQRLQVMKNSNIYINDVIIYVPGMGHSISADKGCLDFNQQEYDLLLKKHFDLKYSIFFGQSEIYDTMLYPVYSGEDKTPVYLVKVVLSQDKIKNFLRKFNNYNESDTALYNHITNSWLFSLRSNMENRKEAQLEIVSGGGNKNHDAVELINNKKYYVISRFSEELNTSFIQYVPLEDIFRVPDKYGYFLWLYAALSVVILLAYSYSTYKFVKHPINNLMKSFRRVEEGDFTVRADIKAANEFNYLFERFNKMVSRLNALIDKVYKQELYAKKSELKQLQSQINPHFLYNSFFMLHRMIIDRDMENSEALSSYLGKYFQYITRNASEEVFLATELEHARSYAQIQQMRFGERLKVEFGDLPEKYRDLPVPRIILQPILENSLLHGLGSTLKKGVVRISFEDIGEGLLITVEDSSNSLQDCDIQMLRNKLSITEDNAETTGIINVHRRLELKFGNGSGISVSRSGLGGLKVDIKIAVTNYNMEA